jgi:hypothetical protein
MNRNTAVLLAVSFLLINGCATHARTSTPVALKVTSDTATDNFVKQVHDITLDAIEQQVPNARPMTIDVKLDVTARMQATPSMNTNFSQPINQQRPVATLSPEPSQEAARPTVPVNQSVFGTDISQQITVYRVVYTISDAAGKVIESNQLMLDNGHLIDAASHTAHTTRNGLVNDTAAYLAGRVKTLNQ